MISPLHFLLAVPDSADDLLAALRRAGYDPRPHIIAQPEALGESLHRRAWDLLIVQHGLPGMSSWDALAWVERQASRLPVIVVTEEVGEGTIVALLEAGARDVIRMSNLERLGVAVAKALRWRQETPHETDAPSADVVFRDFAEHMPIGLYRTTEEGRILYANPAFARLLGYESVDELLGEAVSGAITYSRDAFTEMLREEGIVHNYEASWERDGETLCTRENTRAVRDSEGRLLYYEGTIEDITEEQKTLQALRDSEASLRTMAETTGLVFYRRRSESNDYEQVSASIESLTGYTPEGLEEQGGLEALVEQREVISGENDREEPTLVLYHLRTADGEIRWVEDSAHPWTDESGEIIGRVGVLRDVTERHGHEEMERKQSGRRLARQKVLTELSSLGGEEDEILQKVTAAAARATDTGRVSLWLIDDDAGEVQCRDLYVLDDDAHRTDPSFRIDSMTDIFDLLGQRRVIATSDVLGKPAAERYGLDVYHARNGVHSVLSAPVRRQGRVMGFIALEHLGEPRTWTEDEEDFAVAVADLVALTVERSGRGEAEAALQRSEQRYRAISELAADFAVALRIGADNTTDIAWATAAFERVSSYTPDELSGYEDLIGLVHEDDRARVEETLAPLKNGETVSLEYRIHTKGGDERWIAHRSRLIDDREEGCAYVYVSGRDVTRRKQFEADLVEARTRAEALARQKSTFLASMSHEIRTPLTAMLGFTGVLSEEVSPENREFVQLIGKSGQRLMETLNSVLDLARLESEQMELSPTPLDIVQEAREAVRLLAPLADEKGIDLRLEERDGEVIAPLDAVCLRRILNNLIGNAVKFTDRGEVVVGASLDGPLVRLWVRDTGIGMDEAFLPNLFGEFQQEAEGQEVGSGLGLAITRRLVDMMNGSITVESTKGEGSTFTLTFPVVFGEEQVQQAVEMALAKGEARRKQQKDDRSRVLVVEDNAEVRRLIERILGKQYRVDAAANVGVALDLLNASVYDALVLDIHLSGEESGVELLHTARALPQHESVVALALTAYALPGDRERFLDSGFDAYLSKPFTKEELMETLRTVGMAVSDV